MNENEGQFRSAAFGGFHRQDVLDYIETMTREHQAALAAAQEEKDALAQEKAEVESALAEEKAARRRAEDRQMLLENRASAAAGGQKDLEEALEAAKAQLEEQSAQLAQAREEAERLRSQLQTETADVQAKLQEEVKELKAQLQVLKPQAESWQRIKDTAGDIEVSAHERAQVTFQEAQAHAAEIRAQAIQWVLEIQSRCDKLQQDLRTSIAAAEKELDAVRTSFSLAEVDVEGFQQALSQLVASTENT